MDKMSTPTTGPSSPTTGAQQLRLALMRDPRVKTPTKKSPTKLPSSVGVRREAVAPSLGVVNLVGGLLNSSRPQQAPGQLSQAQLVSKSVHQALSQPSTLTQTFLFSNKTKNVPVVPKVKPSASVVMKGTEDGKQKDGKQTSSVLTQSSQPQLSQKQFVGSKNRVVQNSLPTKPAQPPPLIKLFNKAAQDSLLHIKASAPAIITAPFFTSTSSATSKLAPAKPPPAKTHGPPSKDLTSEDILPPKAKRVKTMKTALLPISRVKTIMKTNIQSPQPAPQLSQESVLVITKATELFISKLSKEAEKGAAQTDTSAALEYDQLANSVQAKDKFKFLQDILPKKVLARECLPVE